MKERHFQALCTFPDCNGFEQDGEKECVHALPHPYDEECCHNISCERLGGNNSCSIVSTDDGGKTHKIVKPACEMTRLNKKRRKNEITH